MILIKSRECGHNLYICFIDYRKAFDSVVHDVLWTSMVEMGFPAHIIQLIEGRYDNQKAVVRTNYGLTKFFHIGKGVRQGNVSDEDSDTCVVDNLSGNQLRASACAKIKRADGVNFIGDFEASNDDSLEDGHRVITECPTEPTKAKKR